MGRKTTMQDVANALGVSRITVWKVFNHKGGVSDTLWQQVISKAQELGYTHSAFSEPPRRPAAPAKNAAPERMTVSVIVSRPESSLFWTGIIHRIAKELAKLDVNLMYTYVPSAYQEGYELPDLLTLGAVQGAIIINVYDADMLRLISALAIPKVFLDTVSEVKPHTLSGDVILLEGHESIRRITGTILEKGRRNIGFIGDIAYARTNLERYEGFLSALKAHRVPLKRENCLLGPFDIYGYDAQIGAFLNGFDQMPEAFVCASDYVTHFVFRHLANLGLRVPQDVAVSGYDGTREYDNVAGVLTTVPVSTAALGKRLVQALMMRIDSPEAPQEVVYLYQDVVYGASTDF